MTKRKINNPLALAVLACLWERPMHPYEMSTTLRERGKDQSIKLNYGALYTVVEALQQHEFIVAQRGVQRLHLIESEYLLAMQEAELAWTRQFDEAIRSGTVEGVVEWAAFHRAAAEQKHNEPQEQTEHERH
jgi:DNA-binding PadR family transcriptional regulator